MNSTEILQKKQWYEDPGLFGFAMQAKQLTGEREDRAFALKQQKDLAEAQLGFEKDKAAVANKMQGLQMEAGNIQGEAYLQMDIDRMLANNPDLTYDKPDPLWHPERQAKWAREVAGYKRAVANKQGYVTKYTELSNAFKAFIGDTATSPTVNQNVNKSNRWQTW